MRFKPVKQFSAILAQENFEPTLSWAFRVMIALNVPLIIIPFFTGFSFEVIWAAFGAYMLSLIDYRGLHSKKIVIQCIAAVVIFISGVLGMLVSGSLWISVAAMFVVGMFAALIRNWRDYGSTIGVSAGFFFLLGLAYPLQPAQAIDCGLYILAGSAWAIFITVLSFQLRPANPVKRSIAKIWSANTALLDALVANNSREVINGEMEVRKLINLSIDLFERPGSDNRHKAEGHYTILMELRRNAALFSATLSAMHEEMDVLNSDAFKMVKDASLEKTISSFAQVSARMAIVIFTSRPDDLTIANVRVKRCEVAMQVFREATGKLTLTENEERSLRHFVSTLEQAYGYLKHSSELLEQKLNIGKSDRTESYKLSIDSFAVGVNRQTLGNIIQNVASVNSEQMRYALRVSLALSVGVFLFKYFNIDHGYWIPLTLIIVIQPYYGATRKKGVERIIGTIAGTVLGGVVMLLPLPHYAFIIMLIVVSFLVAYYLRNNYKVGVFFTTVMMVILMQLTQQASWTLIGWRILSTLLGALLAFIAAYAFWPMWEKQRFPVLMKESLRNVKDYLLQVTRFYNKLLPASDTWFKSRRMTEAANNAVFSSVQRMYEEPVRTQNKVDVCFAMVGIIIRITREITSIALLAQHNKKRTINNSLNNFTHHATVLLNQLAARIGVDVPRIQPDFSELKKCLDDPVFENDEQLHLVMMELEKIIFEIEALFKMESDLHEPGVVS